MIVTTTRRIKNDNRMFCAEWYALPSYKFDPAILKINQYAYPDGDVPDEFYKKHAIYYVDTDNNNRLVKAYELEDQWNNMTFIEGQDVLGINGKITDDSYLHHLANAVDELTKRVIVMENRLDALDLAPLEYRITELSKMAVQIGDTINVKVTDNI